MIGPCRKPSAIGDKATNTHVLTELYAQWKDSPVQYDLLALWTQLGILSNQGAAEPGAANPGTAQSRHRQS